MEEKGKKDKKQEIIRKTWEYLLKHGMERSSIGDLCRETGLSQSSLYHWFANKDDIWISAGKFGIAKVVDRLLVYTLDHTNDIEGYFDTYLDEVEKDKEELRLALQITTSPVFGERMREKAKDFRIFYEKFADQLIGIFGCTYLQAEIFTYTIIACTIDYVIWDDKLKTQMLLDNLCKKVVRKLEKADEQKIIQMEV